MTLPVLLSDLALRARLLWNRKALLLLEERRLLAAQQQPFESFSFLFFLEELKFMISETVLDARCVFSVAKSR